MLFPQKATLKTKQELQVPEKERAKKTQKKNTKRKPMKIETTVRTENKSPKECSLEPSIIWQTIFFHVRKKKNHKTKVKRNMTKKENVKTNEQETTPKASHVKKQERRYTEENKKVTPKLNEQDAGPRRSRGKKQRRQFKLAPNRG
jgi:hypothetical protein